MSQWPAISEIARQVNSQHRTALEFTRQALDALERHTEYNATVAVLADESMERARQVDKRVAEHGSAGALAGVPFIAKDNFLVFGGETRAASNILKGFKAPYQSTVIDRLEAEGAICIAKANMDAFGHGGSTENSDAVVTKNAHDPTKVPGGSSGGSSTVVALDIVPFATGTDTGGSNRHPASLSGCIGYKPTYGLLSRSGVIAMASSTDTVGFLTRTVDDLAQLVEVSAGIDPLDSTTVPRDSHAYTDLDTDLSGKKIGVIKQWIGEGIDPDVKATILAATNKLKAAGADVQEISLPSLPLALAVYYIVVPAEISSNLSRYDGQRYGFTSSDSADKTLQGSYLDARGGGFGAEAKRRIMIGTYVLTSGYYDAYYNKAQTVRTKLINEFAEAFNHVDVMVGPVAPNVAFDIGKHAADPLQMYLQDMMTVAPSLVGVPALSVPAGLAHGLPVGLQIVAAQGSDRTAFGVAKAFEEINT
jgi:aspartyl-tRNA(Asn)/glutamyl-tRNA(Gln) amidotransferase subunit A